LRKDNLIDCKLFLNKFHLDIYLEDYMVESLKYIIKSLKRIKPKGNKASGDTW